MSRLPPQIEQVIDGKKVPGWEVRPITEAGITYSLSSERMPDDAGRFTGMNLYIEAVEDATGTHLWKTRYFEHDFDPRLETDVQEIFPVDLAFGANGNDLIIKLEHYDTETGRNIFTVLKSDGSLV